MGLSQFSPKFDLIGFSRLQETTFWKTPTIGVILTYFIPVCNHLRLVKMKKQVEGCCLKKKKKSWLFFHKTCTCTIFVIITWSELGIQFQSCE